MNDENEIIKRIGAVVDITEERSREDQLLQANKAKSDFLTHMSHEFRTPLNSILGFAQIISNDKQSKISGANLRRIENILKSGKHLLYLVDDLLDLSRIEAGNISIALNPVDAFAVFNDALETVENLAAEKQIALTVDQQIEELPLVLSDEGRLKQVFLNLLSNAIKYNQDGGKINASFEIQDDDYLRINIQDTGIGIEPDRFDSIFKPFVRPWTLTPQILGSGIGLSIAKRLIELMDGNIGFDSEEGKGSTFWIELKTTESAGTNIEVGEILPVIDQLTCEAIDEKSKQVLYIDDDSSSLELMEDIFEDITVANLTTSDDAINGLRIAEEVLPDLIILDINLPIMTGLEMIKILRKNQSTKKIPVVALSADALPEHILNGLEHGFSAYLSKPIILSELHSVVEENLK